MKQKKILNYKTFIILISGLILLPLQAKDFEFEKRYNKSYSADEIAVLVVNNKHGNVVVKDDGSSTVTIDVVVKVESSSSRDGQALLDKISVKIEKKENEVSAHTFVAKQKGFKFLNNKLSINYTINIPDSKKLQIKNYYGNIYIDRLQAPGRIEAKYGSLYAGELFFAEGEQNEIYIGYGKGEIERISSAVVDVEYSKLKVDEGEKIDLDCQYSGVRLGNFKHINVDAQFDGVDITSTETIDADCNYAGLNIGFLGKSLKARASFGGVKVQKVSPGFSYIDVSNSYGSIKLGIPEGVASFVDLKAGYGSISLPDNWDLSVNKGMNSKEVRGNVRGSSDKKIELNVSFGGIKIWEYEVSKIEL